MLLCRSDFAGQNLNGIGADYRIIIGLHGGDSAVAFWNSIADPEFWDLTFDTTGFAYHNVPMDTNIFEFGIRWSDMGSSYGAYIVGVDPSRGGDRFSIAKRAGRKMWGVTSRKFNDYKLGDGVAMCVSVLNEVDPEIGKKCYPPDRHPLSDRP